MPLADFNKKMMIMVYKAKRMSSRSNKLVKKVKLKSKNADIFPITSIQRLLELEADLNEEPFYSHVVNCTSFLILLSCQFSRT